MESFAFYVGQRIKKYRKLRGYTIEQFSRMINKSKATLSKYENGDITVDVETLYDISLALDIEMKYFIDRREPIVENNAVSAKDGFFGYHNYYVYHFDGRSHQCVRSLLHLSESDDDTGAAAALYMRVNSFHDLNSYQHLYLGKAMFYEKISHFVMADQVNDAGKLFLSALTPPHDNGPAVGLICGVTNTPFYAPVAIKALISHEPLEEDDRVINAVKLDKDDFHLLRYYNMLVADRSVTFPFDY